MSTPNDKPKDVICPICGGKNCTDSLLCITSISSFKN